MASESEDYEYAYSEDEEDDEYPEAEAGDVSMDWSTSADNPNAAPMNFGGGKKQLRCCGFAAKITVCIYCIIYY